jgi:peptide/nickel transport system substrate-binding protein
MLRNVFDTIGTPIQGPFPPTVSVADSSLAQIPYDTLKARALLDSAGWMPGPDGVRVKNGRRLEFGISTPSSSAARHQYAVLLQDAFRRVGAAARLDETDFATFSAKQAGHGFDTEIAAYLTDPSPTGFKQSWSTAGIARDGSNFPSYSNPAVDALLDSAAAAFDPARTKSYARRAFEIIIDDAPGIWLYQPLTVAGLHKRIRTKTPRADGYWSGLADWWIPAGERTARDQIGLRPAQ